MKRENYIFGYGSLIENESRMRTTPEAATVYPVIVKGFKRGWFARTGENSLSTTFLGCIQDEESLVNGVIYKVSEDDLFKIDKREQGYIRKLIDISHVNFLFNIDDNNVEIWIYTNEFENIKQLENNLPNKNFPIVQSYVDMCINGCLEIEENYEKAKEIQFTKLFIESTEYWNKFWANDRIFPRRPFIYQPNANTIDTFLKNFLKEKTLFNQIYIE